jgi:ribosomal protein S25
MAAFYHVYESIPPKKKKKKKKKKVNLVDQETLEYIRKEIT